MNLSWRRLTGFDVFSFQKHGLNPRLTHWLQGFSTPQEVDTFSVLLDDMVQLVVGLGGSLKVGGWNE
jgi:hypothetical protein